MDRVSLIRLILQSTTIVVTVATVVVVVVVIILIVLIQDLLQFMIYSTTYITDLPTHYTQ